LLCQAAAILVIVLFVLLVIILAWKSMPAFRTIGLRFFTEQDWDPEPDHRIFGALGFIYGTLATSLIAMLIAVPLGVATAAFLSEVAPNWLRRPAAYLVEMLAAIPSVVYGYWGMFVLAPKVQVLFTWLGGPNTGGSGILAAGIVLSIMILPYIAAISYDVCQAVPKSQRAGALALGATSWQTIWKVVLPYARPGIVGACFLALGRALGETMAVTMLIGNRPDIPQPFWKIRPWDMGDSIASVIANQFTEATYDLYLSALVQLGLVLLLVSIVVNTLARLLIWRVGRVGSPKMPLFRRRLATLRGTEVARPDGNGAPAPEYLSQSARADTNHETDSEEAEPHTPIRVSPARRRFTHGVNFLMMGVLGLALVLTVIPLFLILGYLLYQGFGGLSLEFFTRLPKPVGETGGGMANAVYGSSMLIVLASLFAVPVGVLAAIYLAEYRSDRLGPVVRFIGELLTGVPSIVVGLFGYYLVVLPMSAWTHQRVKFSAWAGAFALGVIMIPIVMRAAEESLKLVPRTIRDASYALGASHWQTVLRVTLPAALSAIITGVFLAVARIAGETAPLLLTASSNQYFPRSPNDFTPSLPVYIFNYAISPYQDWHRQGWVAALVLLAFVMLLSFGVRLLIGRRAMMAGRAD
jgi:phosphate transport system permease protein